MKICEILRNFTKICFDTFLICLDTFFQIYSLWIISLLAFGLKRIPMCLLAACWFLQQSASTFEIMVSPST